MLWSMVPPQLPGARGSLLLKVTLQRGRPGPLYSGWNSFSFPSSHTIIRVVLYGFLGLLVGREVGKPWRVAVVLTVVLLVSSITFSRLYLGALWLSDVAAGQRSRLDRTGLLNASILARMAVTAGWPGIIACPPPAGSWALGGPVMIRTGVPLPTHQQLVLRLWRSDVILSTDATSLPLWIGTVVAERIDHVMALVTVAREQLNMGSALFGMGRNVLIARATACRACPPAGK